MTQQEFNYQYPDDGLDLVYASEDNDTQSCLDILRNTKQDVNQQNIQGMTPLMFSILNQNFELTNVLLSQYKVNTRLYNKHEVTVCKKYQQNMKNFVGKPQNALMLAILKIDLQSVKLILERSSKRNKQINQALKFAYNFTIKSKDYEEVNPDEYLILDQLCKYQTEKQVLNLNLYIGFGARKNMPNFCRKIVQYFDLNQLTDCGNLALEEAANSCNYEVCQLFLQNGADPNLCETQHGWSPLTIACELGFHNVVKVLTDYGADPNLCDSSGRFSLDCAMSTFHFDPSQIYRFDKIKQILFENFVTPRDFQQEAALKQYISSLTDYEKIIKFQQVFSYSKDLSNFIEKQRVTVLNCLINYCNQKLLQYHLQNN